MLGSGDVRVEGEAAAVNPLAFEKGDEKLAWDAGSNVDRKRSLDLLRKYVRKLYDD